MSNFWTPGKDWKDIESEQYCDYYGHENGELIPMSEPGFVTMRATKPKNPLSATGYRATNPCYERKNK